MDLGNVCSASLTGVTGQGFMTFINTLIAAQCALSNNEIYPADYGSHLQNGDEFDFVVVGAGSAGSILASRLSENPNWKVLLIEAGGYPSMNSEIPQVAFSNIQSSKDWNYTVEASEQSMLGLKNKQTVYPRGKMLGGTGSLNGMFYVRPNRRDFEIWSNKGNQLWDYDSVLPYFKKFEDLQDTEDDCMGKGGELKLGKYIIDCPIRSTLIESFKELGYEPYSENRPLGYLDCYTNIYKGTRCSTAKAYLPAMKARKNAFLILNAQVTKVILNSALTATGVEMLLNDKLITVKASKEVILSAGSINSPQILMNSGIGPKEHLEDLGIPVKKNLKVGENLKDHIFITALSLNVAPNVIPEINSKTLMDNWYQYVMHKKGPLARSPFSNLVLFFNTKNDSIYPDMQMYYLPFHKNDPTGALKTTQNMFNLPPEVIKAQSENNLILLPLGLAYPKSVGKVTLRSKNVLDKPKIELNHLSDEEGEDVKTMVESVRFVQKLIKTKGFAPHVLGITELDLVNCRGFVPDSDAFWECVIRNIASPTYHPVSTCKMGPEDDPTAVVDQRLRVRGVKKLRVVDASIFPDMISCNIHATVIMIGQRASDMIKEDWTMHKIEL